MYILNRLSKYLTLLASVAVAIFRDAAATRCRCIEVFFLRRVFYLPSLFLLAGCFRGAGPSSGRIEVTVIIEVWNLVRHFLFVFANCIEALNFVWWKSVCGDLALKIHVCAGCSWELAVSVAGARGRRRQSKSTGHNLRLKLRNGALRLSHDTFSLRTWL